MPVNNYHISTFVEDYTILGIGLDGFGEAMFDFEEAWEYGEEISFTHYLFV